MIFNNVKNITMPEGAVKQISIDNSVAWHKIYDVPGTNTTDWFIQGSFKSFRVVRGKVANLSISIPKDGDDPHQNVKWLVVAYENGKQTKFNKVNINTRDTDRNIYTMIYTVPVNEEPREAIFTVYAIFADGTASSTAQTFNITIQPD